MQQQLSVISGHGNHSFQKRKSLSARRRQGAKSGASPDERASQALAALRSEEVRASLREESLKRKKKPASKAGVVTAMPQSVAMKSHLRRALEHREDPERAGQPFKVKRTIADLAAITNSAGGTGYAKNVQLDELPAFADFTAMFDQYRFSHVRVLIYPRINTHNLAVGAVVTTLTCTPLAVTFDPDDSTAPASIDEVLEYPQCRVRSGFDNWTYEYKPRAAIAAYGGAFTQFADFDQWCDCASDDVEWYAFKAYSAGDGASQTTHQIWDLFFEVEVEFRFVH